MHVPSFVNTKLSDEALVKYITLSVVYQVMRYALSGAILLSILHFLNFTQKHACILLQI